VDERASPVSDGPVPRAQQPGTAAAPARGNRPGRFWYWPAVLALCAGVIWPLASVRATDMKIQAFQRVPLPAGGRVSLPRAGTYVISYEAPGLSDRTVPSFRVRARAVTPALKVYLLGSSSGSVYSSGPADGIAVLDLKVSRAGAVFLDGPRAPRVPGGSALAVGTALPGFMVTVMPGIGLMFLGIGGIIVVATLRSRGSLMRVRYPSLIP
jgi:hypothetical protein